MHESHCQKFEFIFEDAEAGIDEGFQCLRINLRNSMSQKHRLIDRQGIRSSVSVGEVVKFVKASTRDFLGSTCQ